jgi:hypothetical protein
VAAFYTGRSGLAHISFVHEANRWFPQMAAKYDFAYEATTTRDQLNAAFLSRCQVVLFLDTRPDVLAQRKAYSCAILENPAVLGESPRLDANSPNQRCT